MHEILFRGKRVDNGEWVEGFYSRVTNNWEQKNVHFITCFKDLDNGETVLTRQEIVIPETIGQYTGLTDKDGKKIFEGDIVTAPYIDPIFHSAWNEGNPTENTVVKYADGAFYIEYIESKHKITLFGLLDGEKEAEVIGNIHDNPELMRGAEQ